MITVNFNEKLPTFGMFNHDDKKIRIKNPDEIFAKQKKSKGGIYLNMRCCCSDSDCNNKVSFYYSGLSYYFGSKNLGSDTEINIHPSHDEVKGKANNILYAPTNENLKEFTDFFETVKEAIDFKKSLLNGLYAQLQVRIKGYPEIQIMVRKDEKGIHFLLFEISKDLPLVPLLSEAESYYECLGVIGKLPSDTDTSKIKNDHADMKNLFFGPVIEWVKSLGKENQLDLTISSIWVMPE